MTKQQKPECEEKVKNSWPHKGLAIGSLVLVVVFWIGSWFVLKYFFAPHDLVHSSMGLAGDAFGAVNALFSGLAFVGLIYTILLQREELSLQRKEIVDTREEIKGQREALELQANTMAKQRFETTFFNLLNFNVEKISKYGTPALGYAADFIASSINKLENGSYLYGRQDVVFNTLAGIKASYEGLISGDASFFTSYATRLKLTLDFIDRTNFPDNDKYFYTDVLKIYLSEGELKFILYYFMFANDEDFKKLACKYKILTQLNYIKISYQDVLFENVDPKSLGLITPD